MVWKNRVRKQLKLKWKGGGKRENWGGGGFFHNLPKIRCIFFCNHSSYKLEFCTTGKRRVSSIHLRCRIFFKFILPLEKCENLMWIIWCSNSISGFPAEPGNLENLEIFNFICPGPEIAWNLPPKLQKPGQNKKTWIKLGMFRYTTFWLYIETIAHCHRMRQSLPEGQTKSM